MSNPMEQFEIKTLIPIKVSGFDISFTNSALFMLSAVFFSTLLFLLCLRKTSIVPSTAQAGAESVYDFIHNLLKDSVGVQGLKYFYFIFSLFLLLSEMCLVFSRIRLPLHHM